MHTLTTPEESGESKTAEYLRMERRINNIHISPGLSLAAQEDSVATFKSLGLSEDQAKRLFAITMIRLSTAFPDGASLLQSEERVRQNYENIFIGDKNLVTILDEKLTGRAELIHQQVAEHMRGTNGPVLDFGAGDLQVTQMLQDRGGLDIRGVDVRNYRKDAGAKNPVPFQPYNGYSLPFADQTFAKVLATNVLHHAGETEVADEPTEGNEQALHELCRVARDEIIVIETVPDPAYVKQDLRAAMERTFWNDYLYNRLFHDADVPVPGRYETREGWLKRFAAHGWRPKRVINLGYDQKTICDYHVLYAFVRMHAIQDISTATRATLPTIE